MLFQYRVITDQIYTSISQKNCPKHFGYLKEVNRNFIIKLQNCQNLKIEHFVHNSWTKRCAKLRIWLQKNISYFIFS